MPKARRKETPPRVLRVSGEFIRIGFLCYIYVLERRVTEAGHRL